VKTLLARFFGIFFLPQLFSTDQEYSENFSKRNSLHDLVSRVLHPVMAGKDTMRKEVIDLTEKVFSGGNKNSVRYP
jgi:hypothetical protein